MNVLNKLFRERKVSKHKHQNILPDRTPEDEINIQDFAINPAFTRFKDQPLEVSSDPQADKEAIDSIEPEYFDEDTFDPTAHVLNKLPEVIDMRQISEDQSKLRKQLRAVSKKVSEVVLENHPAYDVELNRVMELQSSLKEATDICSNGRRELAMAEQYFTTTSLELFSNVRKRQYLYSILKTVKTIRTLQRTDIHLLQMLEEEDYPGAIQLCLECQKAASTFRHYNCISELSSKLQDTLVMIEEAMDVALSKTCLNFDENHYAKIQTAYRLLGKTQTAMDQLNMYFANAIHDTAFTKVLGYVELCSGTPGGSFQKQQYADLCKNVSNEMFTPCLIDLCKALWEVMNSYHKTMNWHDNFETEALKEAEESGNSSVELNINSRYIKQKLQHGLTGIWSGVQQKVKTYVLCTDLSQFKYDDFIKVLDILKRLIEVGEDFCKSKSEGLQDSIRKQSLNYFRNYHEACIEQLQLFLESEEWQPIPVKQSFSLLQLQEFRFMRYISEQQLNQNLNSDEIDVKYGYFEKYENSGSPFDVQLEEEGEEDVLETSKDGENGIFNNNSDYDSDDEIADDLKQDMVIENVDELPDMKKSETKHRRMSSPWLSQKQAPMLTNSTLEMCRFFGKYLQMMNVLNPIAFDVVQCMSQLFDYYLYSIYSFFGNDFTSTVTEENFLSSKLRATLRRIKDHMIIQDTNSNTAEKTGLRIRHPYLSHRIVLHSSSNLYGLAERVVATESLVFIACQIEFLQKYLEAMIPSSKKAFLQQFYSQTVGTAAEIRQPVYRSVALQAVDYEGLIQQMAVVKWDLSDITSQHSSYVDFLISELIKFREQIININDVVPIPHVVVQILWENCIKITNRTFVEGYANVRKCTNEGRAMMLLDYNSFIMKLESLTDLRPIPEKDYVESYIKAYYHPEAQLELWIREHKKYSGSQLKSLVSCVSHISKKVRQRLIILIDDLEKFK